MKNRTEIESNKSSCNSRPAGLCLKSTVGTENRLQASVRIMRDASKRGGWRQLTAPGKGQGGPPLSLCSYKLQPSPLDPILHLQCCSKDKENSDSRSPQSARITSYSCDTPSKGARTPPHPPSNTQFCFGHWLAVFQAGLVMTLCSCTWCQMPQVRSSTIFT